MKIEIPFEFGQEVYFLRGKPIHATICSLKLFSSGSIHLTLIPDRFDGNNSITVTSDQVYLTRDEALQRLFELKNGCQLNMAI